MATALTAIMQRTGRELGVMTHLIPSASVSAMTATTFTATGFLQNTNLAADYFQTRQAGAVRGGAATAADFWRPLGTLANSTGVLTQVGANWADTTADDIEIWLYGFRRDQEGLASLNRVTIHDYISTKVFISHLSGLDGDMMLSTDTNFQDVGTPTTSAKISTGTQNTPFGTRAYRLVADAVGEGTRAPSGGIVTTQGSPFSAFAIVAADVGTASFSAYDVTNSAVIGTVVTQSERRPQLMLQRGTLPATCKATAVQVLSTTNPGDNYINQLALYDHSNLSCPLPAVVTEGFQALRILQARPQYNTSGDVYDAGSFDYVPLTEGLDYWLVIDPANVQPYKVHFANASYYDWPLMVEARIPLSSQTTFALEADSTAGPLERLVPRLKLDWLETCFNSGSRRLDDWTFQHNLATEQLAKASNSRQAVSVAPAIPPWYPRLNAS